MDLAKEKLHNIKLTLSALRREFEMILPDPWRSRMLFSRRKEIWRQAGVMFIHVPKAAGTSISHAVYGRFMGHIPARHLAEIAPDFFKSIPRFTVVRDPFTRIVSSYQFARYGADKGDGPMAAMHRPGKYRGNDFHNIDVFVQEWLTEQDLTRVDHVFRPQTYYTHDASRKFLCGFLGHIEDLSAVENHLRTSFNLSLSFKHLNTTSQKHAMSPESRKIIGELYRDDFELLGYPT